MNLNFDFLKNVELTAPDKKTVTRSKSEKNPKDGLFLRVFASGKIYPSQELVDKYSLEYVKKDQESTNNGLDIFKSVDWPMFPAASTDHFIFVAPVPKNSPKVDLFGQVGYEADGTPKNSVMEQGGGSFGATLIEMLEQVYGITIPKGEYVDLEVKSDVVVKSPNDIYYVPKTVTRGEKKGEITVVRRENVEVMPLAPVSTDNEEVPAEPETEQDPQMSEEPKETTPQPVEDNWNSEATFDETPEQPEFDPATVYPEVPSDDEDDNDMPNIPGV